MLLLSRFCGSFIVLVMLYAFHCKLEFATLTAAVTDKLSTNGAARYCQKMTLAIPSRFPPLSSTMTMTLLAVGVKNAIMVTKQKLAWTSVDEGSIGQMIQALYVCEKWYTQ